MNPTSRTMRILCVGINHKAAGVGLREWLALDAEASSRALSELSSQWPSAEFVTLSTCNRTEIYTARPLHGQPREHELLSWWGNFRGVEMAAFEQAIYTLSDASVVRHLFAVTSGLDSLVVGEVQSTSQIKAAYDAARQAGTARSVMNKLFQKALHVAKDVRSRTGIAAGRVSVASVAVDCVMQSMDKAFGASGLAGKCVLNVGAGKMNELMLRRLGRLGAGRMLLANRSPARAARLAEQFGGEAVELDDLPEHLRVADVVLTSTGCERAVISREMLLQAQQRRGGRPMLIVDIAVPRDVEPEAAQIENIFLYNIDDLERLAASSLRGRHTQRVAAEAIIAKHVAEALSRLKIRDVSPTIDAMYQFMRRIADEELAGATNKLSDHDQAEADKQILTRSLHRTIRRILHPVAHNLRKAAGSDAAGAYADALRKLFELEEEQ